ncbi:MAG: asparagine synthase (glutamine-hydrolyzing) [Bacteriovoracaceae bacterium]|jgi:asparagine synthase (glutamine-hydrolysing)|nr:asparagine synthase (glutamine-hydrolyzing) [Bacteriovoracaceae bacterium]
MCGIFGYIHHSKLDHGPIFEELRRRGPDGSGEFTHPFTYHGESKNLTFLHARLSILDLSDAGSQPMSSECGRYTLCYNGEIYNFLEIRSELEKKGHKFVSNSDTEVLLRGYIEHKDQILKKLQGIFDFAIFDKKENELFIARDQLGVKPLYYTNSNESFSFSSELAPLVKSKLLSPLKLRDQSVWDFLTLGNVPAPHTIFEEIKVLPPGHKALITNAGLKIQKYWNLCDVAPLKEKIDYREATDTVNTKFTQILERQMRSDVPISAFLSGGIDSGLLVGLMGQISGKKINTFSIGFGSEGEDLNEWALAKLVAGRFNTNHTEVSISQDDFKNCLDDYIDSMDQPTADGLNSYFISRSVQKKYKVAFSGLGADEVFGGYPLFKIAYKNASSPIKAPFLPLRVMRKLGFEHMAFDPNKLEKYRFINREIFNLSKSKCEYRWNDELDAYQNISAFETNHYLPNMLLRDADAISMHHSLEVRVPYIDPELFEYVYSLPQDLKHANHINKKLLIDSFPGVLPDEITKAPKRGFEMPVGNWIAKVLSAELSTLHEKLSDLALPEGLVQAMVKRFYSNPRDYRGVWSLLVLTMWRERQKL